MKRKTFILTLILLLLSSTINVYGDDGFNSVTINFINQDNEVLKESVTSQVESGTSVLIDFEEYKIDNYEMDSIVVNGETRDSLDTLTIEQMSEDLEITINYIALSSYTLNYYLDDGNEIKLHKSISKVGRVNEEVPKESDIEVIDGYKLVRNDVENIKEDGSTIINLYYAYDKYLVTFDLNGGHDGPDGIYGEYGTKIDNLKDPVKDGYDFIGWFKDAGCNEPLDTSDLYIRGNVIYYAGYKIKDEKALVTVIYYGENANDDNYSYLGKKEFEVKIGQEFTIENTGNEFFHKHDLSCFGVMDETPVNLSDHQLNGFTALSPDLEDDYVYFHKNNGLYKSETYYYKKDGNFYKTDKYHISYIIGDSVFLKDHSYDATDEFMLFKPAFTCGSKYEFDGAQTITVKEKDNILPVYLKRSIYTLSFGNNSDYPNAYYGYIEAKWDFFIYDKFEEITDLDKDNIGWGIVNARSGDTLKLLIGMPRENNNYYLKTKIDGTKHINYYIKVDEEYVRIYTTNWSFFSTQVTESDFIEIDGYEVNKELSIKIGDYLALGDGNNIYYDPKEYNLTLEVYPDVSETFKLRYGELMSNASAYEPKAKTEHEIFNGWYLKSNFEGEPVDLTNKKMPDHNLTLYAKWDKKKMNVRFVDEKTSLNETKLISYGDLITGAPTIEDNAFIGWVRDNSSSLVVNLDNYVVTSDVTLYALYDKDIFVNYTIKYQSENGKDLATPKHGSIIKGSSIYIIAKSKDELSGPYKNEYKPIETEHIFVAEELSNTFIITYVPVGKYSLTLNPINLEGNDSIIAYINGYGFDDLEIAINKQTTVLGFYENEDYEVSFDNSYSYTYDNIESVYFNANKDKTIDLNLNKHSRKFNESENHKLNIFN